MTLNSFNQCTKFLVMVLKPCENTKRRDTKELKFKKAYWTSQYKQNVSHYVYHKVINFNSYHFSQNKK